MRPILFTIPLFDGIPVHAYGFFIMLGFIVGSWIAARRGPRIKVPSEFVLDLSLYVMIAGIVGSRVFYVAQYHATYDWSILDLSDGGFNIVACVIGWLVPLAWLLYGPKNPDRPKRSFLRTLLVVAGGCCLLGLVAGRGAWLLQHRADPRYSYEMFKIWHGGIVFYGGLIAAVAVAFWYIKSHGQSILVVSDLFLPEVALGYAFARIGCFLNGCCYGHPTHVAWAVTYPANSPAWDDQIAAKLISLSAKETLPVHPSQIYATIISVGIFFLLSALWKRNKVAGAVMCYYGILYSIYRFLIEITRGDERREWPRWLPVDLQMTISQYISVWMFLASIVLLFILHRLAKRVPAEASSVAAVSDRR